MAKLSLLLFLSLLLQREKGGREGPTGTIPSCTTQKERKMELTPEMLQELVSKAVAAAIATKKTKGSSKEKKARTPMTEEQKASNRAKVDAVTVTNFEAKGYQNVQPRVDVMTYDKWIENGRRVRKGEK